MMAATHTGRSRHGGSTTLGMRRCYSLMSGQLCNGQSSGLHVGGDEEQMQQQNIKDIEGSLKRKQPDMEGRYENERAQDEDEDGYGDGVAGGYGDDAHPGGSGKGSSCGRDGDGATGSNGVGGGDSIGSLENQVMSSAAEANAAAAKMRRRKKFVGVRQRPSGRWVAEIKDTTQKIRMWLGTFDTAEDAARAYDEAACLLRGSNTRTNFLPAPLSPSGASSSPLASRLALMLRARRKQNMPSTTPSPPSPNPVATPADLNNPLLFSSFCNNPSSSPNSYPHSHDSLQGAAMAGDDDGLTLGTNPSHPSNQRQSSSLHHPFKRMYGQRQRAGDMLNQGSFQHVLSCNGTHEINRNDQLYNSRVEANPWRLPSSNYKSESEFSDSDHNSSHISTNSPINTPLEGKHDYNCQVFSFMDHHHSSDSNSEEVDHSQIFVRDKHVVNAEDINALTHDQHLLSGMHLHHQYHNYRGGRFMDALLGINDDIILDPLPVQLNSVSTMESYYNDHSAMLPFDFTVESNSLDASIDDFPLISELSGKLEESEKGMMNSGINGTCGQINARSNQLELEMKRLSFERRASTSLYALNGVHEMLRKKTHNNMNSTQLDLNYVTGNSSASSTSFNFLSTSPTFMLSSPWKPLMPAPSSSTSEDEQGALPINAHSSVTSMASSSMSSHENSTSRCSPHDRSGPKDPTHDTSSTKDNSDAQSQQEAAMWNSWDLPPLCTLVA